MLEGAFRFQGRFKIKCAIHCGGLMKGTITFLSSPNDMGDSGNTKINSKTDRDGGREQGKTQSSRAESLRARGPREGKKARGARWENNSSRIKHN